MYDFEHGNCLTDWLASLDLGMTRGSRHDQEARRHDRPAESQDQRWFLQLGSEGAS